MKIQRFKVLQENFLEERDFSNSPRENLLTFRRRSTIKYNESY